MVRASPFQALADPEHAFMTTATVPQTVQILAPQQVVQRSIPTLERQVDDAVASRPQTIDLVVSAIQVVDSAGLNWMVALLQRLETLNIRLRLVNPSSIMSDALMATRLDARFTIQNSAQEGGVHGSR
jgi:anti-anti-sigma factor